MLNMKKILAMILVFTLSFAHFAIVTESVATTSFVSLFGNKEKTGNENVEFDAYLTNEEEKSEAMSSEVNNENLAIGLQLGIKAGYLKNGKVEIKAEEDKDLNFEIKEDNKVEDIDQVQSLENNVITLNKINNSSEKLEISIPIHYVMEEYINEEKLNSKANIIFSGIYVDDNGKENEISKKIELQLAWKDEREVKVSQEVAKYVQYGNDGVILQTIVKVDSSNENKNSLPVKETELNIDVPSIQNVAPDEITVIANSTAGTNGAGVGETAFSDKNWKYSKENQTLNIKVENEKKLVDIESDEYLKIEGEEKEQEERYYSKAGVDEYVITYSFKGITLAEELNTKSKISAKLVKFSGIKAENNETIATVEKEDNIELKGQTGNIVSYNIENETKEISKSYGYLNKEVELNSKTAINVSYADIVEEMLVEDVENYYLDRTENKVAADDIYYKEVSINKTNFNEILGEDGNVQILDTTGNVLATINKDMQANEEENYVVAFQDRVSKIVIKTSAPKNIGNLVVANKKAVSNVSLDRNTYANIASIVTTTIQKAKFSYVTDLVELGNCTIKTKLNDTNTDFNLKIDRESLTTAKTNSNVEMRIELNNNKETSDIYGNSVFEIEMPQYVTNMSNISASMLAGEGLDIASAETYSRDGKIIVKVTLAGNQTNVNSSVLTNGTNIVITSDITVDIYAPADIQKIKAYGYNSLATNYANAAQYTINEATIVGSQEKDIEFSAPNGVVAINTTANYNNVGSSLTSIKQGEQVDYIDIYSEAKQATMDVVVINNNDNKISNLKVLGRIPFKGVKDLTTEKDLGTTVDTKLVNGIVSNPENVGEFTIYYSENKNATEDLNDSSNKWIQNPENFENIKSYLIVPTDENYKMETKQVLKFNYQYEIPANLEHNENIYGTFIAKYTNNIESANIDETAEPDLIGLTTGVGPELALTLKSNKESVKVNDDITLTATVKNTGKDLAKNVVVNIPTIPNTTYVSAKVDRDTAKVDYVDGKVVVNMENLSVDTEVNIDVNLKANVVEQTEKINAVATTTAKDLQKELESNKVTINFEAAEFEIRQFRDSETEEDHAYQRGEKFNVIVYINNLTEKTQNNVKVTAKLPKELKLEKAFSRENVQEGPAKEVENAVYDENTNTVMWTFDKLEPTGKTLNMVLQVGDLKEGKTSDSVKIESTVSADGTDTYKANELKINIGKNSLIVTQTTSTETYVQEGSIINYTFNIKNQGASAANDLVLTDIVPKGLIVKSMSFATSDGENINLNMSEKEEASAVVSVQPNDEVNVNVAALATPLVESDELTVKNEATLTGEGVTSEAIKSNSVTHIIQATGKKSNNEDESNSDAFNPTATGDITKSYKISGIAWIDSNKDGMRSDDEKRMSNVTAMLVDSNSGVIKNTINTNEKGEYTFAGIQNGQYLVLFKYDTKLYTTTTYRKEGVESNINSDVVTTKIEQDSRKENGAVTDVLSVNGANLSNVDIGLAESAQFSLGIDKAITKITVQNAQGTKTEEFENSKLAKYDIAAKHLSGTTVYVEYAITVTNNGDLSGFASEIVDYIPEGMTFNSNLNEAWYTGNDGNLYTKALGDSELATGESKTIKLVLTKKMTAENTGLVSNSAEIADDYNIYGVSDINSTPSNKAQGEDDMSTADTILTVKTGESLIYVSAIIVSLMLGGAVAFIVYERVIKTRKEGGV